ncbi:hypothetical protein MGYG_02317 [Nannizzia gypsea CBS 118893]|uniref:NACHT domain-containing protein n=1 Tax=Arthroderma gypseum (strain ATCC MYA-4604 / CBS 118893) TaxID=535722 RepID=E4UQX9_ARTGP|nr:hypothetical protein MGYG_02317 [Nannizzia gypsea CBS 118893]EFQ99305.1 hypothetical protein MGYG_02317 [Nannizzia gypsea CBS 118893]
MGGDTYKSTGPGSQFNAPKGNQQNITGDNPTVNNYYGGGTEPLREIKEQCLQSLYFQEMERSCEKIKPAVNDTCKWLIRHEKYETWAKNGGLLWVRGKPGSGKSTLLLHALEYTKNIASIDGKNPIILSFFFFNRGTEFQKTPLGFFRSLLYQLLDKTPPKAMDKLLTTFEDRCKKQGKPGERWHWYQKELRFLFESSLRDILESHSVWIFIDALDECDEEYRAEFIEELKDLFERLQPTSSDCHVFFTCRHNPVADPNSESGICAEHQNNSDILTYAQSRLSTRPRIPIVTREAIATTIAKRAKGIFLWARLIIDRALEREPDEFGLEMIEEIISNSQDLYGLYGELIKERKEKGEAELQDTLKLIQWICFARWPLTLDELRWAITINTNIKSPYQPLKEFKNSRYYTSNNEVMERRVKTYSCGLAEVVELDQTRVVQFIHQSVKDFLLHKGLSTLDHSRSSMGNAIGRAHYQLSRACIRYFAIVGVVQAPSDLTSIIAYLEFFGRIAALMSEFPFLRYATTSWKLHVQQSESHNVPQDDLLDYFNWPSEDLIETWAQLRMGRRGYGKHTLLQIVSEYGMISPLRAILQRADEKGVDITSVNSASQSALFFAVQGGDDTAVELLINTGKFDVEVENFTALSLLSWVILKLLPNMGETDADTTDGVKIIPLLFAFSRLYVVMVKFLCTLRWLISKPIPNRHKVDVNTMNARGMTPLMCAVLRGHVNMVKLLLNIRNINADIRGRRGESLLSYAAQGGHESIIKLLLDIRRTDADINARGRNDHTPLSLATKGGHEAVVKLLLNTGKVDADINARDRNGHTPLSLAARGGYEAVVKLLLDTGKVDDINALDNEGQTALHVAADWPRETVVKLLLDTGNVDINVRDNKGQTALHKAARQGAKAVVQLLLNDDRVDINIKDNNGQTAFGLAIKRGLNLDTWLGYFLILGKRPMASLPRRPRDRRGRLISMKRATIERPHSKVPHSIARQSEGGQSDSRRWISRCSLEETR